MDEEQALASPLAGNLRGIRRSVSSSIFAGRPVAPAPKPDPETTSLLSQNSLALSNVSEQLNTINRSISVLSNSLATIQQNLALSDQLERQREAAKQKREAILAEQGLREGKESELEKKVQNALFFPVRRIAQKTQSIFSRLTSFLLILVSGWLTQQTFDFLKLKSEGNVEGLSRFKRKFLKDLLFLGATFTIFFIAIKKILASIGIIGSLALKFVVGNILFAPFKAVGNFIKAAISKFSKQLVITFKNLVKNAPELLKNIKSGAPEAVKNSDNVIRRAIFNSIERIKSVFKGGAKEGVEQGAKKGFLKNIGGSLLGIDIAFDSLFSFLDFKKDVKNLEEKGLDTGENITKTAVGEGGGFLANLVVLSAGLVAFPEVKSSLIGGIILSILASQSGESFESLLKKGLGVDSESINEKSQEMKENNEIKFEKKENNDDESLSFLKGMKKDMSADKIASLMDAAPQIINMDSGGGGEADNGVAKSSEKPSVTLPFILSSDTTNTSLILSESLYNVA